MGKLFKKEIGITLIALVITIIILIILAGVAINLTIGENGIFKTANLSKEESKKAELKEYLDLKVLEEQTENYFETAKTIIEKTQQKLVNNKNELLKFGKEIDIREVEEDGENIFFDVVIDKVLYRVTIKGTSAITDKDNPSKANLVTLAEPTITSIKVQAEGEDESSGIYSYIFQKSLTNENTSFETVETVFTSEEICEYEYKSLTVGETIYIRVIVKDKANNTKVSEAISVTTKTLEQEENIIGKYVNYIPKGETVNVSGSTVGTGNQSFVEDTSLKWRIWSVDNTTLTLISDKPTNYKLNLKYDAGLNNGISTMNNICAGNYKNADYPITEIRNLKYEDITAVMTDTGKSTTASSANASSYWVNPNYYSLVCSSAQDSDIRISKILATEIM